MAGMCSIVVADGHTNIVRVWVALVIGLSEEETCVVLGYYRVATRFALQNSFRVSSVGNTSNTSKVFIRSS